MATAPVKPQQLHNFPISLKWSQTTTTANHRSATGNNYQSHHRLSTTSTTTTRTTTPSPTRAHDSETESDLELSQSATRRHHRVGSRSARLHRLSCSTFLTTEKTENFQVAMDQQNDIDNNKIKNEKEAAVEEEEESSRPWKLRPRKGITTNTSNKETASFQEQREREKDNNNNNTTTFQQPKSMRLRGVAESSSGGGLEKKEKRKFWIALSREEIEEDVFSLTGSRPSRRPQKRPKAIQKLLDSAFPGLWLVGTTADSYRIADPPVKR